MKKSCIDIKTNCVFKVCSKYCMQDLPCYINEEKERCELSIITKGKKGTYEESRVKIKIKSTTRNKEKLL